MGLRLRGCVEIAINDAKGNQVGYTKVSNIVVDAGRHFVGRRIQSNSPPADVISYLGVGSSGNPPTQSQTDLSAPVFRKTIGTIITSSLTGISPFFQCLASFAPEEANGVIAEAGLFTQATGGIMFARTTFASSTKATTNSMSMTYTVSF